ncbi:54S ribosomal protein yml6, mitochondrial [Rhizina undulata]
MACRSIYTQTRLFGGRAVSDVARPIFTPGISRSMVTEVESITVQSSSPSVKVLPAEPPTPVPFAYRKPPTVLATIHSFPMLEPLRFQSFPTTFLHAPLRRDILHRAVIYEGDAHRLGRANTKWRNEVHGSGRKIRPQKGTGRARLGDKKSPMLRGGGVAHGPKPRDFSTDLPKKVYDMAWRTALSYRYKRGDLIVVEDTLEIQDPDSELIRAIMKKNQWGNENSRSLLITTEERPNLEKALDAIGEEGRVLTKEEVDVKDLLELGRIVIEREALLWFEQEHNQVHGSA